MICPAILGDFSHPMLSERDVNILRALNGKRLMYANHGQGREAHGVGAATDLVFRGMTQPDFEIEPTDTRPADL